jgi:hypothetical protein
MSDFCDFYAVPFLYYTYDDFAHTSSSVFWKRNSNLTNSLLSENKFRSSHECQFTLFKVLCSKYFWYRSFPSVTKREEWMFLHPVVSVLVRVTFSSHCVCPLFSRYIMDLRLILWEIFFDANIKAWISCGCEWKKISSHSSVVKIYRVPLAKKSLVTIRSQFFSQNVKKILVY